MSTSSCGSYCQIGGRQRDFIVKGSRKTLILPVPKVAWQFTGKLFANLYEGSAYQRGCIVITTLVMQIHETQQCWARACLRGSSHPWPLCIHSMLVSSLIKGNVRSL